MQAHKLFKIFLLIIISNVSLSKFLDKSFFSSSQLKYVKVNAKALKGYLNDRTFYVVDTREIATAALGYISSSLIVPSSMFVWIDAVIPDMAKVVLITDLENRDKTIESFIGLGKYNFIGYCIYDEIVESASFYIRKIEYDPNTKASITKIVENKGNIIDIREINEFKETGVIKEANLIPLRTFQDDYEKIPKEGNVYVFCKSGARAVVGMSYAKRAGYTNKFIIMKGGMTQAIKEGYPVVPYEG